MMYVSMKESKRTMNTKDLLIMIDPQNDFCEGGSLAVPGADTAFMTRLAEFSKRFKNIVITQDYHPDGHSSFASSHEGAEPFTEIDMSYGRQMLWPDHCVQGTVGAAFHPVIVLGPLRTAHMIIRKGMNPAIDSYSAFFENDKITPTGLRGYVEEQGYQRVYFVGLALDYCVAYSALDLAKSGLEQLEVVVVEDMTKGIAAGSVADTALKFGDAGVIIITSDMV